MTVVATLPAETRTVIAALQALRGIAQRVGGDGRDRARAAVALCASAPVDGL